MPCNCHRNGSFVVALNFNINLTINYSCRHFWRQQKRNANKKRNIDVIQCQKRIIQLFSFCCSIMSDDKSREDDESKGASQAPPNYQLQQTLEGHKKAVSSVKFSHEGRWLASACKWNEKEQPQILSIRIISKRKIEMCDKEDERKRKRWRATTSKTHFVDQPLFSIDSFVNMKNPVTSYIE
jgi:WD40 repeat protein